jgi:hypothetical protein
MIFARLSRHLGFSKFVTSVEASYNSIWACYQVVQTSKFSLDGKDYNYVPEYKGQRMTHIM